LIDFDIDDIIRVPPYMSFINFNLFLRPMLLKDINTFLTISLSMNLRESLISRKSVIYCLLKRVPGKAFSNILLSPCLVAHVRSI